MSDTTRLQRHIAIMSDACIEGAVVYRAERDDNRSADAPIDDNWERRSDIPTNWNWFKYDYRVVLPKVVDFEAIGECGCYIDRIAAGAAQGAYNNPADAIALIRTQLDIIVSKL
jgi:hypothetical protein